MRVSESFGLCGSHLSIVSPFELKLKEFKNTRIHKRRTSPKLPEPPHRHVTWPLETPRPPGGQRVSGSVQVPWCPDTPENLCARLGPGRLAEGVLTPTRGLPDQRPPHAVASSCPWPSAASALSAAIARDGLSERVRAAAGIRELTCPRPSFPRGGGPVALCGKLRSLAVTSCSGIMTRTPLPDSFVQKDCFSPRGRCPRRNPVPPTLSHGPGKTPGAASWLLFGQHMETQQEGSWAHAGSCRFGGPGGPPLCPVIPSSLSGNSHKGGQQGLGTHVYFMNDFRERGEKTIQNVIQEAVFFLLCFVSK